MNTLVLRFLFLTNPFATLISTIPWQVTKRSTNNITIPFESETEAAGGLLCHPRSRMWMLLLWRWIKPL